MRSRRLRQAVLPARLHGLRAGAEGSFAGLTANVPEAGE